MQDLGVPKKFLGVEVGWGLDGIFHCQRKYTLARLTRSHPASTPMESNHNLGRAFVLVLDNREQYQRLVGRLLYLS